jgi:tRNA(Ile)-lysidine synthase
MADAQSLKAIRRFEATVRRYAEAESLWPEDGGLLVAVSGGPDSSALLYVLAKLSRRREIDLVVAHFNHGLRGDRVAAREEAAVRRLASSLELPVVVGHGNAQALADAEKLSLEDAARRERYRFLATTARRNGCTHVAVGHTVTDQAETVLAHVLRGAGLDGLAAMPARAPWPIAGGERLVLVRPLLRLSHEDTLTYCAANRIEALEDESNRSPRFQRNRLRHEVMPLLRDFNPRVEEALQRLADAARLDLDYIDSVARMSLADAQGGTVSMKRALLREAHPAVRRQTLRLAFERTAGDPQGLGERNVLAMERLVLQGRTGDVLDLPRNVRAELTRDALLLRIDGAPALVLPDRPVTLSVPGAAQFGTLLVTALPATAVHGAGVSVLVDAEAAGQSLTIRRRRPGDRIQPSGMSETKKLQDLFVDAHVPRAQRDAIPLFETPRGIAWAGGLRIAEWARPREGRPMVMLSYREEE